MHQSFFFPPQAQNNQLAHPTLALPRANGWMNNSLQINCSSSQYQSRLMLATQGIFAQEQEENHQLELNALSNSGQLASISLQVNSQKHQEFFNDLQTIVNEQFKKIQSKKIKKRICANSHHCVICHEKVRRKSTVYRLNCRHIFHVNCLEKWKSNKNNCPLCRKQLI